MGHAQDHETGTLRITRVCESCYVVEATENLCNACLEELLEYMAVEFEAEEYAEQLSCDGGLY